MLTPSETIPSHLSKHKPVYSNSKKLRRQYNRLWLKEHFLRTAGFSVSTTESRRLALFQKLSALAIAQNGQREHVPVIDDLTPPEFHQRFVATDTPVVFKGKADAWKSAKWTAASLARVASQETVRLLAVAPGEAKGKPGEGRDVDYQQIAKSMKEGGDLYARFSGLLHQRPELIDDLDLTWFRSMSGHGNETWGFFMGGKGTATGLHSSIAPNLFYQIRGKKRWYIYPAWTAPFFKPEVKGSPYFYSYVDVNDSKNWPIAEAAPGWYADLNPGDILFVPSFAWHQVHNKTASIAVGYRWMSLKQGWRASWIQTLLAATCSNPPLWRAKDHKDLPTLLDSIDY
ncbi:MAG: hypothetical protein CMF59_04985 [Leptospiraceae bacterium]|nr:hypothetical protein [Leptospiraceae bacterium]